MKAAAYAISDHMRQGRLLSGSCLFVYVIIRHYGDGKDTDKITELSV
jgi:hypothetical protein